MKKILSIALLLFATLTYAQEDIKPKYEKVGDQIKATFFHDNGEIAQQGFFNQDNKLEGTWTSFDVNGNKIAAGNYNNGIKIGKWFFWKDQTLTEVDYNNNKIASVNKWKNTSSTVADSN